MPEQAPMTIAEDFGKYAEAFAVIQTGSVMDDGEIFKYSSPVVIGVYATREKASSQKKRQASRVGRIHKWFASDDAIPTPLLAVRVVMIRKPAVRKPKATAEVSAVDVMNAAAADEAPYNAAEHAGSLAHQAINPKAKRK